MLFFLSIITVTTKNNKFFFFHLHSYIIDVVSTIKKKVKVSNPSMHFVNELGHEQKTN